ncbi:hypothetical protein [Streptobacillus ratti]|uniref:hypothetical protein n=1 Tax=Streptobacillus ratti TaxID=1720557 RepID=UPI000934FBE7|nr:hypothetical protein [Streptobacillus ratti]
MRKIFSTLLLIGLTSFTANLTGPKIIHKPNATSNGTRVEAEMTAIAKVVLGFKLKDKYNIAFYYNGTLIENGVGVFGIETGYTF